MEKLSLKKGVFTISLDWEMAWGTRKERVPAKKKQFEEARKIVGLLLELFGNYEISATWAVVGKLFEKPKETRSIWRAGDLVRMVRHFPVAQEIGAHSFSHKDFTRLGEEEAREDVKSWLRSAEEMDIVPRSFVFPYNRVAYQELLREMGFFCYRGPDNVWYRKIPLPFPFGLFLEVVSDFLALSPPCSLPRGKDLLEIPGSMPYLGRDSVMGLVPVGASVKRAKKGLDKAAREKKIFHLWFHPFNIASRKEALLAGLEEILRAGAEKREKGDLDILTMSQVYETLKDGR